MAEIVGGIHIKDLMDGGAILEIRHHETVEDEAAKAEEKECSEALQQYLNLDCLDLGKSYDGEEPFTSISKDMMNLVPNGMIKKKIIREGYGDTPTEGSLVTINYNAYVQFEAQPFDSTFARKKPFSFTVGEGEVIEGLDYVVKSMKINERSQFLIHPDLAYRNFGLDRIPPNSEVLFEIDMCEFRECLKEDKEEGNTREFKSVYPKALALCAQGKKKFRLKDYTGAIKVYNQAVEMLEKSILSDYDEQMKSEELLVRLYTNLLVCCTNADLPKRGCIFAQKILEMAKNKTFQVSAKVFFNHSRCVQMLGDYKFAEKQLLKAKSIEPNNPEIKQALSALKKAQEDHKLKEAKLAKAMLGRT